MDLVEYILKNKVYIFPKSTKYFYTQIEVVNFIFNKGNTKIYAKLLEKTNIEEKSNYNKKIKLPDMYSNNLLYYDPLNNIIKYSRKIKICINGCKLYINI